MKVAINEQEMELEQHLFEIDATMESNPAQALLTLRALFCSARKNDMPQQQQITYLIAKAHFMQSQFHKARVLLERWLSKYADTSVWRLRLLTTYAATLQVTGYETDAYTTYQAALKLAEHERDSFTIERIYHNMVMLLNGMGAYKEAHEFYLKLEPYIAHNPVEKMRVAGIYSWTLTQLGESNRALALLESALAFYNEVRDNRRIGYMWEQRGEIFLHLRMYDQAVEALLKAKRLLEQFGDAKDLCRCNRLLGRLYATIGDFQLASEVYQESIYSASVANMPLLIDNTYYALANCLYALNEHELAADAFKRHVLHVEKSNKLKAYQQVQLLDLLIERQKQLEDQNQAIVHQEKLNALQDETLLQSTRLIEVTSKFSKLHELTLELTRCIGHRAIITRTFNYLSHFIPHSKALLGEWDDEESCYVFYELTSEGLHNDFFDIWDCEADHVLKQLQSHYRVKHILLAPIEYGHAENKIIFCVMRENDDLFDQYDRGLFLAISALILGALQLSVRVQEIDVQKHMHHGLLLATKERHAELVKLSYFDELTGLYNRAGMNYCLEQWLHSFVFPNRVVAVVFDLDHFKEYNDQFGHLAGDRLLEAFGKLIQKRFDKPDFLIARFGGEEFLLLASSNLFGDINRACSEILIEVTRMEVYEKLESRVTVSIGIFEDQVKDLKGFYHLIENADHQLYRAKRQGRNQICKSTGEVYANNR